VRVLELWRYPVKSMQGESVARVDVTPEGFEGDRAYALFDCATGYGLTARRRPELLYASARWRGDGSVAITLPDGRETTDDAELSDWLGTQVELRSSTFDGTRTYEIPLDIETEAPDSWVGWNGPRGAFHDSTRTRVSIVSRGTLGAWDARRFRANIVVDGSGEAELVGGTAKAGSAVLDVGKHIERCVIVTRPQPGGIDRDVGVLRTINREREGRLAVGALVATPGTIAVGDELV